ncbi:hypothetical protein DFH06DRAFT_1313950 [Mycena polygramma]|nr:hypothetical protein DFH06DRAFT_1313950 [Mycena polygramma]
MPAQTLTLSVPPFFNPQSSPFPAVVLGVDSQGRTTYAVEQDEIDGGSTTPLTATLVEGPDHIFYTFSHTAPSEAFTIGFDCGLKNGQAICSGVDSDRRSGLKTETATLSSLAPFVLDVVSTAAPSSHTSPAPGNPSATSTGNSAPRLTASSFGAMTGLLLTAYTLV